MRDNALLLLGFVLGAGCTYLGQYLGRLTNRRLSRCTGIKPGGGTP